MDLSSSSGVEDASADKHATRSGTWSQCHIAPTWGLRPTHLPFSQRPRGLHVAKLPECLKRLVGMRSAIGRTISRPIIVAGVVANPQHRRHALMQRTVGECLRTLNDGEAGSDAGVPLLLWRLVIWLSRRPRSAPRVTPGLEPRQEPPLPHQFVGVYTAVTWSAYIPHI